jgi:hypothetical protein
VCGKFFRLFFLTHWCVVLAFVVIVANDAKPSAGDSLLVDRGLTSLGANSATGGRTNVAWAYGDPKEPGWEPGWILGDDFTLPTQSNSYTISDIRIWIKGYRTTAYSDMFNSVSLMLGTSLDSPLTKLNINPTVTPAIYPDGQIYSGISNLYALDFAVNFTAAGGTKYFFGVLPDAKAIPNGPGSQGEIYYKLFIHSTATTALTGVNSGTDSLLLALLADGTFDSSFSATEYGGPAADFNVQVFGTPEPSGLALLAAGGLTGLIGIWLRRRTRR